MHAHLFLYVVETLYMPMGCAIAFYIVLYAPVYSVITVIDYIIVLYIMLYALDGSVIVSQ